MSSEAIGWTFKHSPYSGAQLVVHLAIADVVNDGHDNQFFMSVDRLADKTRASDRTVQTALKQMVADGYLEIVRGASQHDPTCYRFVFDRTVRSEKSSPLNPGVKSATPTDDATVRGEIHDTPGVKSTAPRGEKSSPKPKEPKLNPRSSSSAETPPHAEPGPDDDDRVAQAARLHAVAALDRRRQAETVKALDPIEDPERWLDRTAKRWTRANAERIAQVLDTWPRCDAEDLLAHVGGNDAPAASPPVEPCDLCADSPGWLKNEADELDRRCPCTTRSAA